MALAMPPTSSPHDITGARLTPAPHFLLHTMTSYFRLRAGDLIDYEGQTCRVVSVSDSSAVVAVTRPPRTFTTLFGVAVHIQPKPALVRISPNSEVPILNR